MARLVRASDQHSEDPGSNPGWISMSFFIFAYTHTPSLTHAHSHILTHTPLTHPHSHTPSLPHPSHTFTHTPSPHTLPHRHTPSHTPHTPSLTHLTTHPHSHILTHPHHTPLTPTPSHTLTHTPLTHTIEPRAKGSPPLWFCHPSRWYEPCGPHTRRRTLC